MIDTFAGKTKNTVLLEKIPPCSYLKVHVCDQCEVEVRVLDHRVVAAAEETQEVLPVLEGVVVLTHQETDERELELCENLFGPEKWIWTPDLVI